MLENHVTAQFKGGRIQLNENHSIDKNYIYR